ncbi:FecCD family ABC transporter permease [Marinobacter sp. DUT-3]|uniref:FecCD family ABC transporter permease n=1 Tax=Marinobacter sp. DUT-3 TaxID=3412036 RepID=UPI003D17E45F
MKWTTPAMVRLGNLSFRFRPVDLAWVTVLLAGLTAGGMIAAGLGSFPLSWQQVWLGFWGLGEDAMAQQVLWQFRLPRIFAAMLVGASLSVAGVILQSLTRNALASPGLIGVESGASVTLLLFLVLFPGLLPGYLLPLTAMAGGLAVATMIVLLSWKNDFSPLRLILVGIGMTSVLGAVAELLITYGDIDRVESALMWLGGSLHNVGWADVSSLALWFMVAGLPVMLAFRQLNVLQLGSLVATSRGLAQRRALIGLLLASVMLTANAVATAGTMVFVGLIGPHLAKQCCGDRHGILLPLAALSGALLVLVGDTLGRTLFAPLQLPAGLVIALVGAPYFIILMARRRDFSN